MHYSMNYENHNIKWFIDGVFMRSSPFCIELTAEHPIYTFNVRGGQNFYKTQLALDFAFIRSDVEDENNVVEVTIRNENNEEVILPLADLRRSSRCIVPLDQFILDPPVTFRLRVGAGPVEVIGIIVKAPRE